MSNLVVDSRPCKDLKNVPIPVFSVVDEAVGTRVLETAGPGMMASLTVLPLTRTTHLQLLNSSHYNIVNVAQILTYYLSPSFSCVL